MPSDRRTFLRELVRTTARATEELAAAVREQLPGDSAPPPDTASLPTTRLASLEELHTLAAEVGLAEHAEAAVALARPGIRLTPGGIGPSRLGGAAELPPWLPWPSRDGIELAFLGQLRLADLPPSELPGDGVLHLFHGAGEFEAVHADEGPAGLVPRPDDLRELPVVASLELTLPPAPPGEEADSGLAEAWTRLRRRLAEAQGVALAGAGGTRAAHRLLGHPDALPRELAVLEDAAAWRLLLQVAADDDLGLAFPGGTRLTVWIRDDDLRAARFHELRAWVC